MTELLLPGNGEGVKRAFHASARELCRVMAAYNGAAFLYRGLSGRGWQPHLLINTVLYAGGYYYERHQVAQHPGSAS